jgi:hypothetical protein
MPNAKSEYPLTLAEILFEELKVTAADLDEARIEREWREVEARISQINELATYSRQQLAEESNLAEINIENQSDNLFETIWTCKQALSSKLVPELYQIIHRLPERRSALCLSGGGVQNADLNLGVIQALIRAGPEAPHLRSATFNLGILQGLARVGVLDKFDYLSTVSGGGFIGSWLTAWIHREKGNVSAVASQLARSPDDPLKPEPEPLHRVRLSAKYLSSQPGLFSIDKFTLLAVYFVNLILNWLVFVPVIMALLMLPRIWVALLKTSYGKVYLDSRPLLVVGFIGATLALTFLFTNLPGVRLFRFSETWFFYFCLIPLVISAMAFTTYWFRLGTGRSTLWSFMVFAIALGMLPWIFSLTVRLIKGQWQASMAGYVVTTGLILVAFPVFGFLIWYVTDVLNLQEYLNVKYFARAYASFAVPLVMALLTIVVAFVVGFTSRFTDVDDQEWWWRLSARFLIVVATWSILHGLVLFGPGLYFRMRSTLFHGGDWTIWDAVKGVGTLIGLISGAIALFGGFKSKSSAESDDGPSRIRTWIVTVSMSLSSMIWAASIIILLSIATNAILASSLSQAGARTLGAGYFSANANDNFQIIYASPGRLLVAVMFLLGVSGWLFGTLININRISLHFYWRNRIMKTFLGASRDKSQTIKGLSDFDPQDNLQMHDLKQRPLHLINTTLNRGSRDRKRDSFTISPLHSGSYRLGYRDSKDYGGFGGISLATAAAVSAAGVSSGQGSAMTSPIMRFIMIFLNVRLGFWLGNSGIAGGSGRFKRPTFDRDSPSQSVRPIFAEALGLTNARSPYVYLSDGGHFENLGLYEMVLRRCRFIVISDASTDPGYRYQSLGQAIRQIRVDLGVPIEMEKMTFGKDLNAETSRENRYCAIGRIRYSAMDKAGGSELDSAYDGALIYIKPSLNGSEPRDVLNYHNENTAFPQDSIVNKEFGDEQFESYRMLGSHMIQTLSSSAVDKPPSSFKRFEEQAKLHLGSR